jgi:hypothetical protein
MLDFREADLFYTACRGGTALSVTSPATRRAGCLRAFHFYRWPSINHKNGLYSYFPPFDNGYFFLKRGSMVIQAITGKRTMGTVSPGNNSGEGVERGSVIPFSAATLRAGKYNSG